MQLSILKSPLSRPERVGERVGCSYAVLTDHAWISAAKSPRELTGSVLSCCLACSRLVRFIALSDMEA